MILDFDQLEARFGEDAFQHIQMPFNMAGWYMDRVALPGGKDATIHMASDQYIALEEVEAEFQGFGKLLHVSVGLPVGRGLDLNIAKRLGVTYEQDQEDGEWQLELSFKTNLTGDYLVWVTNAAQTQCYCRYSVLLR